MSLNHKDNEKFYINLSKNDSSLQFSENTNDILFVSKISDIPSYEATPPSSRTWLLEFLILSLSLHHTTLFLTGFDT